jgi:hypothetical protein
MEHFRFLRQGTSGFSGLVPNGPFLGATAVSAVHDVTHG